MAHKYSKDRQWTQLGAHCQKDLKIIIIIIILNQVEFKATLSTATRSNILFQTYNTADIHSCRSGEGVYFTTI